MIGDEENKPDVMAAARTETSTSIGSISPFEFKESNLDEAWKKWKSRFTIYLHATGLDNATNIRKVCLLLHTMGPGVNEIFDSFEVAVEEIQYADLVKKFDTYFLPKKNLAMDRYRLFMHKQGSEETANEYATALRTLAASCELGNIKDSILRDLFICGMRDLKLRERLLRSSDNETLDKVLEIANTFVLTSAHAAEAQPVHVGATNARNQERERRQQPERRQQQRQQKPRSQSRNRQQSQGSSCNRCGSTHEYQQCPAWGKQCNKCKKMNHWSKMCRGNFKNVNSVEAGDNEYFIGVIQEPKAKDKWMINLNLNGKMIKSQLDTGAMINVIAKQTLKSIGVAGHKVKRCATVLTTINSSLQATGQVKLECHHKNAKYVLDFVVVDVDCETIIGLPTCTQMNLVKLVKTVTFQEKPMDIIKEFQSVFEGLGKLPDKVSLVLDPSVPPKICGNRKVPVQLMDRLKAELDRMENDGIIMKQNEPTDWVSNLCIVEKPNKDLRLCMDPMFLNTAIKRAHFPFPDLETVKSKLVGATHFTVLDATSGFWQLELDEASKKLCTFNTPFGRRSFCRLPFGIKSSPESFLQIVQKYFGDIPGTLVFMDDFLIYGDEKSHAVALRKVLEKAKEIGLTFNKNKSKIDQSQVKYCGHIFSSKGLSVDPEKVKAIENMEPPKDVAELSRLLGMLNYLRDYIPRLAALTDNMRQLLKKGVQYTFTNAMDKDFQELKNILKNSECLAFYDPKKKVTLSVDSSSFSIGCCLMQEKRPVAYASTALTDAQTRYSQIEKEMLAIVYGCKKFHTYLYGREVEVESDHKPLEAIMKKSLAQMPPRLQRLVLRVQGYDLKVKWVPGKELYIADTLSRLTNSPLEKDLAEMDDELALHVNLMTNNLAISPERVEEIKEETKKDAALTTIRKYIIEGWPKYRNLVEKAVEPYWKIRHELYCTEEGLVFKGSALVIPTSLRPKIVQKIHASHAGMTRTLALAKGTVFWPFMTQELTNFLENCQICMQHSASQRPEPLKPHTIGTYPFEKVGIDFCQFNNKKYLVVVDYYSNYPEFALMHNTNAASTIIQLKSIFARHGIPRECVADGGPPFSSSEFATFMKEWDIELTQTSPYLSNSNGLVESTVKIVKSLLKKCQDPYEGLLLFRNTPRGKLNSPAELLMSRKLRTTLPSLESTLRPKVVPVQEHLQKTEEKNKKIKHWYDKGTSELCPIPINSEVHVQLKPKSDFVKGTVVGLCKEPRSYIVACSTGTYRRNRKFIKYNPKQSKAADTEIEPKKKTENCKQSKAGSSRQQQDTYISVSTQSNTEQGYRNSDSVPSVSPSEASIDLSPSASDTEASEELYDRTTFCMQDNPSDSAHVTSEPESEGAQASPSLDIDNGSASDPVEEVEAPGRPVRSRKPVKRFTFSEFH